MPLGASIVGEESERRGGSAHGCVAGLPGRTARVKKRTFEDCPLPLLVKDLIAPPGLEPGLS